MDALNIRERTGLSYAAQNGYMHACGHDGHTAMLLGAAAEIAKIPKLNGTVNLIFQPAEESTVGARAMVEDGLFERFPMDEIYGLHNAPFKPFGTISTRSGNLTSNEDNFNIIIKGGGCHASSPHEGTDPILCFSQIYPALQAIVSRNCNPIHPVVISCTELITDGTRNAIPSTLEIRGDVRCFSKKDQHLVELRMQEICKSICFMNEANVEVTYTYACASVENSEKCAAYVCAAAKEVVGPANVDTFCEPWMASEDFSVYLDHIPGCYFLLGAQDASNKCSSLHSPEYDFPDSLLSIGAEFWKTLVSQRLK